METLKICYGDQRYSKNWKNSDINWEDLCIRLSNTYVTTETMEEFKNKTRAEQDNIKDIGGFVGGHLTGNRRKKDAVECRSMLTLDMDFGIPGIIDDVELLADYGFCVYSTHKHTPEKPRLRFIIPLSRDVDPEEYQAVARLVAADIGIDFFDDTTYEPNRLMYWPSTSVDGQFEYRKVDGPALDPDEYLARYENWKNIASWPISSREIRNTTERAKKQEDPLTKKNIVGAFCRTYTITDAIGKFLGEIYEPSVFDGRYDYIPGEGSAGVQVFDNKWVYSHHGTDPARGKLLNAFDLVRIHKFGKLDEKTAEEMDTSKLPSWKAMCEFAAEDPEVKMQLARDRQAQAEIDFSDQDDNWEASLELNKEGNIKATLDNIVQIMRHDPALKNIAFNCHRDGIDARGELPWKQVKEGWSDADFAALKVYLANLYGVYASDKTKDAVVTVAHERAYHPIKQYLEALPEWDGIPRVETLIIDYFGAEDTSYNRAVIRKTMIAAVARIYRPGTKFDSVLILNGPQGVGKSTFFNRLAGEEWFSDALTLTDMKDKAGPEKLQGYWILELGELAGMRKMDVETVKSFISRRDDKYRAAYGVNVESHPRQCVIVGSTNAESGFLRDVTGNRRFWPVKVNGNGNKKSWEITDEEVKQIWAETLVLWKKGEKLYLEGEDAKEAAEQQSEAMEADEREGLVREYLETLLPKDWENMDLLQRRNYLNGIRITKDRGKGTITRKRVCNLEIWCECFGKFPSDFKKSDSYEIAGIMNKIGGWTKIGPSHFAFYGRQRGYEREK